MEEKNDKKIRRLIAVFGVFVAAAVAAVAFLVLQPVGDPASASDEDVKKTTLQASQPGEDEIATRTSISLGTAVAKTDSTTAAKKTTSTTKQSSTSTKKGSTSNKASSSSASSSSQNDKKLSASSGSGTSQSTEKPSGNTVQEQPQTPAQNAGAETITSGEYILADSDKRLLTEADIAGMSAKELNYAKNEIYARHGRIFSAQELADYFGSKSWYEGTRSPSDFDENSDAIFSEIERKNIEFLKNAEERLQPGGYKPQ